MPVRLLAASALLLLASGCAPTPAAPSAPSATEPTRPARASVTDLEAFNAFVASRPTPDALRARYPGLQVVLPGDLTTKEFRTDHSRYFVELDAEGRVTAGRFQ